MLNLQEHLKNSFIYRLNLDFKNLNSGIITEEAVKLSEVFNNEKYSFYSENKSSYVFNTNVKNLSREIYFYNEFLSKNESRIKNIFDGIDSELKNFAKTVIESEEKLYKNKRMVLQNLTESERISLFEESDFENLENFKDPEKAKYFNNRNMCNTKHNLLKLPIKESVKVGYDFIQIDYNKSTNGVIKRDLNNLEEENSSFQYFAKRKSNKGAKLCLKLRFSHKEKINELVFNDGSLYPIFIEKIENENNEEVAFKSIQRGIKDIISFEEALSVKILYIYFIQNKSIEYGREENGVFKDLINNSYIKEKVFLEKSEASNFIYEFTLDRLEIFRNSYKKEGIFRYSKPIKVSNLNNINVRTNYHINNDNVNVDYYLEISSFENQFAYENKIKSNVTVVKYPIEGSFFSVGNNLIKEVKLIAILRGANSNIYNTDLIQSIHIDIF